IIKCRHRGSPVAAKGPQISILPLREFLPLAHSHPERRRIRAAENIAVGYLQQSQWPLPCRIARAIDEQQRLGLGHFDCSAPRPFFPPGNRLLSNVYAIESPCGIQATLSLAYLIGCDRLALLERQEALNRFPPRLCLTRDCDISDDRPRPLA